MEWFKIAKYEKKKKPKKCCNVGTYGCHVLVPGLKDNLGRKIYVDKCILNIIILLNHNGFKTKASCCGHGEMPPSILFEELNLLKGK